MITEKEKEYGKQYRQSHKEEIKEYAKNYRERHRQKWKFYNKRYYNSFRKKKAISPPEIGCKHRPMIRYEDKYQFYINGQVWSKKLQRWKKMSLQTNGRYFFYCLSVNGQKNKTEYIHRLIAQNFILNRQLPNNYQVHHIDKNPKNNQVDNLLVLDPVQHKQFHKTKERV